jgi:tetratricopeptide (TPR) repeat protein
MACAFYRSDLHLRSDEKSLAIASCKRALALNPDMVAAQQSLSRILLDTEQFEQAEASYRREIELTPEHFGPYHQLGVVLSRMKRHAGAIEQFKHAISLNPRSGASYFRLGETYTEFDSESGECLALAQPVQINTWGHPDTSGLPTLDYYVSAECFEPADAQDHYSEQLVHFTSLGRSKSIILAVWCARRDSNSRPPGS